MSRCNGKLTASQIATGIIREHPAFTPYQINALLLTVNRTLQATQRAMSRSNRRFRGHIIPIGAIQ